MKKIIILALISFTLSVSAQSKDIVAKFDVYLDNKKVESDSIYVGMCRTDASPEMLKICDRFTTFLEPNHTYKVVITRPGYNKQILKVEANASHKELNFKIYLSRNEPDCFIGYLKYNKITNKYENY